MFSREELKLHKQLFWTSFSEYCRTIPRLRRRTTMFLLYNTKLRGVELKFEVDKRLTAVVLEFNDRNPERRFSRYEHFVSYRPVFMEYFGDEASLVFEPSHMLEVQKEVSRISVVRTDLDYLNSAHWPEIFSFMASNMLHMEDAFKEIKPTLE